MFPNKITIFNVHEVEQDGETSLEYHRNVVDDVFYYTEKIVVQEGNGEKYSTAHHVIFSNIALQNYVPYKDFTFEQGKYSLSENDIIVLDEVDDITDLKDLEESRVDYFLIKTILDNTYGNEELQNIEVTN